MDSRTSLEKKREELRRLGYGHRSKKASAGVSGAGYGSPAAARTGLAPAYRPSAKYRSVLGERTNNATNIAAAQQKRPAFKSQPLARPDVVPSTYPGPSAHSTSSADVYLVKQIDTLRRRNRELAEKNSALGSQVAVQQSTIETLERRLRDRFQRDQQDEDANFRLENQVRRLKRQLAGLEEQLGRRTAELRAVESQKLALETVMVDERLGDVEEVAGGWNDAETNADVSLPRSSSWDTVELMGLDLTKPGHYSEDNTQDLLNVIY